MANRGFMRYGNITIQGNNTNLYSVLSISGKGIAKTIQFYFHGADSTGTFHQNVQIRIDGIDQFASPTDQSSIFPSIIGGASSQPASPSSTDFTTTRSDPTNWILQTIWHANLPYTTSFEILIANQASTTSHTGVTITGIEEV